MMMMSNILIAILSCARDQDKHQAIRDTWLQQSTVDHVFYGGHGFESRQHDEIAVDAEDDYGHLFDKCKALFRIALHCDYKVVLHAFVDTYVDVPRLLKARELFVDKDYVGHRTCGGDEAHFAPIQFNELGRAEYASGGCGALLSARALRVVLASEFYDPYDDLAIGTALALKGIPLYHEPRFQKHGAFLKPGSITTHLSQGTGNYDAEWMYACHEISLAPSSRL